MKKYKWITIKRILNEVFADKPCYRIFNNQTNAQLGFISWYKPWKEYVFSSKQGCVFNNECLKDVLDFIEVQIPLLKK